MQIAVIAASAALALAALAAGLTLEVPPAYPEFIVGHLSWRADAKLQDLVAPLMFLATFVLAYFGATALLRKRWTASEGTAGRETNGRLVLLAAYVALAAAASALLLRIMTAHDLADLVSARLIRQGEIWPHRAIAAAALFVIVLLAAWRSLRRLVFESPWPPGSRGADEILVQFLVWSAPLFAALAGMLVVRSADPTWCWVSAAGLLVVIAAAAGARRRGEPAGATAAGLAAFAALLIAFVPAELALLLGRLPAFREYAIDATFLAAATITLAAIGFGTAGVVSALAPAHLDRWLPRLLLIGQIGLPLFFLTLYPAELAAPDGQSARYATTPALKVLLAGLVVWGWIDIARRYVTAAGAPALRLVSPLGLFALVVAIRIGNTIPPNLSPDDYHFGESLLGWWSYLKGTIPYVGYIPPHGLVNDDLPGFVAHVFYDGTATAVPEARRLVAALLGLLAYGSIYAFSGSLALAVASALLLAGYLGWLFLVPFLCLWLGGTRPGEHPSRWLAIWLVTAPVVVLGVPAQGLLAVAASAVVALWCIAALPKDAARARIGWLATAAAVLLVAGAATPLAAMLGGALRYVVENAPINQLAWGIPWHASLRHEGRYAALFEIARMSWMAVPVIGVLAAVSGATARADRRTLLPAIAAILLIVLLIPYSMGRIDPGHPSRTGTVSLFAWTALLPLAVWRIASPVARGAMLLAIAALGGVLTLGTITVSALGSAVSPRVAAGPLRDARQAGLHDVGLASAQDEHWQRLVDLRRLLSARLADAETYLDLSNRNAHYFYTDRLPPMPVSAPYNMPSVEQQQRAVAALSRSLPKLALLEASNFGTHDGPLALRNPVLFRFVLDHYEPAWESGFVVGYSGRGGDDRSPAKLALLDRAFAVRDLRRIPVAWGRSEASLAGRMDLIGRLETLRKADGRVVADLSRLQISGRDAGLLRFEFSCAGRKAAPGIVVQWWGDGAAQDDAARLVFSGADGTLIVPLDAYPRWVLLRRPQGVAIGLNDARACSAIGVAHAALYQRKALKNGSRPATGYE